LTETNERDIKTIMSIDILRNYPAARFGLSRRGWGVLNIGPRRHDLADRTLRSRKDDD